MCSCAQARYMIYKYICTAQVENDIFSYINPCS